MWPPFMSDRGRRSLATLFKKKVTVVQKRMEVKNTVSLTDFGSRAYHSSKVRIDYFGPSCSPLRD